MSAQVVIIGGGQGGLSAAIHARLAGADVLLLEQHAQVGGKAAGISQDGYRLDPGPSIIILTRLYEDVFRKAGRKMADYLRFHRLDPFSRVYFEGLEPLDLPAGREACLETLAEFAPQDAAALKKLLGDLDAVAPHIDQSVFRRPYEKPWQLLDRHLIATATRFNVRATYKELVDEMFQSPLLRSFFYGFPSYGGQTYDSKAPGALMIPYLMIAEGVWYPEGGVATIPAAFARLARELGVEIRTGVKVVGLEHDKGRAKAVVTESGDRISSDTIISNLDRSAVRGWLGEHHDWPPSLSYFTVHWGIRRRLEGLSHHTLLVPRDFEKGFEDLYRNNRFPDPPIVYLNDTTSTDPATAPEGCTNLFAVVTAPGDHPGLAWDERALDYARSTRNVLDRFGFPFSDDEIDFQRIQSPTYFAREHGNYRGSLYGPHEKHRPMGGLFPFPNRDPDLKNLFYCGGSVQPGAGLPMVTLSGAFAASAALGKSRKLS